MQLKRQKELENPKIEVHVSSENDTIKIAVSDNGKGIDESVNT